MNSDEGWQYHVPNVDTDTDRWWQATDDIAKKRNDPNSPLDQDPNRLPPAEIAARIPGYNDSLPGFGLVDADVLDSNCLSQVSLIPLCVSLYLRSGSDEGRRFFCQAQFLFSQGIMDLTINHNLSNTWLQFNESAQLEFLRGGFRYLEKTKAANTLPGSSAHHTRKFNCPELCRDVLMRHGGRGFLDLIQSLILEDPESQPKQPVLLPCPRFDALIGWRDDEPDGHRKHWLSLRRMWRTEYIREFPIISQGHKLTWR